MTLTREKLVNKCQVRFEWVEVEGFGKVGIRHVSQLQVSRRMARLFDKSGGVIAGATELRPTHMLVDQLMADEDTPMFRDEDIEMLSQLASSLLDPLISAITRFNGDAEKKDEAGSDDGEAS